MIWQDCIPFGGSLQNENLFPCLFLLIEATCILWPLTPALSSKPAKASQVFLTQQHFDVPLLKWISWFSLIRTLVITSGYLNNLKILNRICRSPFIKYSNTFKVSGIWDYYLTNQRAQSIPFPLYISYL